MDSLLNRYRNITVLLLVVAGQLVLLAVQVKDDRDIPFIRVWTITAVTPFARFVEAVRGGGAGFFRDYIHLHNADAENRQLRDEVGKLKMDNIFLRNELSQADRVKALQMFQAETQSKTLAARVFGVGAPPAPRWSIVDRGSAAGVQRGMAVVTPDGIVGKVIGVYPTASQVLLVTDPDFAAGVISQKNQARGDLKGTGKNYCTVDYVPSGDKVEVGEWFYTSGDDRIFPRGFPAGVVKEVRDAQPFKEVLVEPSGLSRGLEDVLIVLSGVHQEIPKTPPSNQPLYIAPPPPASASPDAGATGATGATSATGTEADRLRARYKAIGDAQNHVFGEGLPGSKPPNFNLTAPAGGVHGRHCAGCSWRPCGSRCFGRKGRSARYWRKGWRGPLRRKGCYKRHFTCHGTGRWRRPRTSDGRSQHYRNAAHRTRCRRRQGPFARDRSETDCPFGRDRCSACYRRKWSHGRPAPLMDYSSGPVLLSNQRESQISRFRAWIVLAIPLAAILFQLFVPRFFEFLGFIEMPLLVVIYFALVRRSQIAGLLTGALVGLAQDSLNKTPVGMLGIVNTLVGYFAASVGLKIDVDHAGVRLPLTFFFYCFHQVLYWVMVRALLSRPMVFDWQRTAHTRAVELDHRRVALSLSR